MDIEVVKRLYQYSLFTLKLFKLYCGLDSSVLNLNPCIFTQNIRLSKNGPYGGPAFATSLLDYFALSKDLRQNIENFGGKLMKEEIENISTVVNYSGLRPKETQRFLEEIGCKPKTFNELETFTRRLCKFPDKEGKQRVIAISDYFSQCSLSNLHLLLFDFLSLMPTDFTFDQDKFLKEIPVIGDNQNVNWYSIDLTAATDRFPFFTVKEILSEILGSEAANLLENILCKQKFKLSGHRKYVSYSVGTPMGTLSS